MPLGSGKNGAAVAFDPRLGYYYAVFAGNEDFPLSMFNSTGQPIDTFSSAGFDARGLWYNPESGDLEGNGYGDAGIMILTRDEDGRPEYADWASYLFSPPDDNSSVCFDTSKKAFVYYVGGMLFFYGYESSLQEKGISVDDIILQNINATTCIYTGIPEAEFGLLDFATRRILLLNREGKMTRSLPLPANAPAPERFNFSYCNGHFWLFNMETRTWMGYKLK